MYLSDILKNLFALNYSIPQNPKLTPKNPQPVRIQFITFESSTNFETAKDNQLSVISHTKFECWWRYL